ENPLGGEPVAVVTIERARPGAAKTAHRTPAESGAPAPAGGAVSAGPQGAAPAPAPSGPLLIQVPQDGGPAIRTPTLDPALTETSKYGALPKIAPDGRRPAEMFASTSVAEAEDKRPKIAIMIGGLGVSREQTSRVLEKLPRMVTLGFTPYGDNLEGWA